MNRITMSRTRNGEQMYTLYRYPKGHRKAGEVYIKPTGGTTPGRSACRFTDKHGHDILFRHLLHAQLWEQAVESI